MVDTPWCRITPKPARLKPDHGSAKAPHQMVGAGSRPEIAVLGKGYFVRMVAAGVGDSRSEEEEDATPKRRRLRRGNQITTDDVDGEEEEYPEYTVARINDRRGSMGARQYLVQWEDKTAEWKCARELSNCADLVKTCDRYLERHPDRLRSYVEFISMDVPSIKLMADSPKDDCAFHALQMEVELMGGMDRQAAELGRLDEDYRRRMAINDSGRFGGLKFGHLKKFLRDEFPRTGWTVCRKAFMNNWYTGVGTGPLGIAQLAWRTKDPLEDGTYLVYALKPSQQGHCIAMQKMGDSIVVREDGSTFGIMTQTWMRRICFVRKILLQLAPE